jgi:hypothetical protein
MVRPSALAVLRLTAISNLVGIYVELAGDGGRRPFLDVEIAQDLSLVFRGDRHDRVAADAAGWLVGVDDLVELWCQLLDALGALRRCAAIIASDGRAAGCRRRDRQQVLAAHAPASKPERSLHVGTDQATPTGMIPPGRNDCVIAHTPKIATISPSSGAWRKPGWK